MVAGSLSVAGGAAVMVSRSRAAARADRLALRLARASEAAFVDAARRLAIAARDSADAVRDEIVRAARVAAPAIDGVLVYEQHDGALRCIVAFGERFAYFTGSSVALDDAAALPARRVRARPWRPPHRGGGST